MNHVNIRGMFFACQHALRIMDRQGYGPVINIASAQTFRGFRRTAIYAATKGAVGQLTKSLAVEFADRNVTVNAISPGWVLTEMTRPRFDDPVLNEWIVNGIPMGRLGEPDEMASVVVFLALPAAAYVTGVILPVDGGWVAA